MRVVTISYNLLTQLPQARYLTTHLQLDNTIPFQVRGTVKDSKQLTDKQAQNNLF